MQIKMCDLTNRLSELNISQQISSSHISDCLIFFQVPSSNTASSVPSNEPTTEATPDPLPVSPKIQSARITLDSLSSSTSIQNLTVGQLKDVLAQNFVSYKGCVEKTELINKVELLYRDHQQQNELNTNSKNLLYLLFSLNLFVTF